MISKVFNVDCMVYMQSLPDNFFELAIVDPPYGIGATKMSMGEGFSGGEYKPKTRLNTGSGKLKNRILNTSDCSWDNHAPDENYFKELFRVSVNQIIWGGNYFNLPPTRCFVAWDKMQPWENFSQVELAWTSFDKPAKLYRQMNGGYNIEKKIHPTQKPVELYEFLIDRFACVGDKIFDSHMGSGSSRIAAYRMGYDFYGCEINKEYFDASEQRFQKATIQQSLFFS